MNRTTPPFPSLLATARRRGGRAGFILRICGVLVCAVSLAAGAASGPTEYQVKAAFVFNFVKFTDWPAAAFTNGQGRLVIGVAGENPFNRALEDVVKGESISGRPITLKPLQPGEDASACHVLFVSRSETDRLPAVLESVKGKPILTISDLDQFCQQGGMINLVLSTSGTVKPEINPDAARGAGLQISSKLLHLPSVKLVKTEP